MGLNNKMIKERLICVIFTGFLVNIPMYHFHQTCDHVHYSFNCNF